MVQAAASASLEEAAAGQPGVTGATHQESLSEPGSTTGGPAASHQEEEEEEEEQQQQQQQQPHEQANLVLQLLLGTHPSSSRRRRRLLLYDFHTVCREGHAATLRTISHLQLDKAEQQGVPFEHQVSVLGAAVKATRLTITTGHLEPLLAYFRGQRQRPVGASQLEGGAVLAPDNCSDADGGVGYSSSTTDKTTPAAAEAASAASSACTRASTSCAAPAAGGQATAAAAEIKPSGPMYRRVSIDGELTAAVAQQVVQLLDLLPGTHNLLELELGGGSWFFEDYEFDYKEAMSPPHFGSHAVPQAAAGAACCGPLAAQSNGSSDSSSSQRRGCHATSLTTYGWRRSCRALVVCGPCCAFLPITDLEPVLGSLQQLHVLSGSSLDCTELPLYAASLRSLRALELHESHGGAAMFACVAGCTDLRHLGIARCHTVSMPSTTLPALVRLTSLHMDLRRSVLSSEALESVCDVSGLRSLRLMNSGVGSLPVRATALTALRTLIWHAPRATEPLQLEVVWRLSSLASLSVGGYVVAVPEGISQLRNLHSLCVRSSSLASLPASISSLKELRQLSVVDSSLTVLPEFVTALTKLTSFYGNRMKAEEQSPAVQVFLQGLSRCEWAAGS